MFSFTPEILIKRRIFRLWVFSLLTLLVMTGGAFASAPSIPFTVNLSEAVNVVTTGGTPSITVDVGGKTRSATYTSGTGTSALVFTYTATAGDVDLDGVTLTSPIQLNGGTIKDLNGNDATLTFTVPNTSNVKVSYPSLAMDFTYDADGRYSLNGTVYDSFTSFLSAAGGTFSRASVGTYFNSSGVLQTASSGTARFDYNPSTLAARGILIEEGRTNYFKNSSTLPSGANLTPTLTSNVATAPDGTTTADRVATSVSGSGVYGIASTDAPLTAGTAYTLSTFVKRESGVNTISFGVPNNYTNNAGDWLTVFNFSTNTFSSTNANLSNPTYQDVGNGWIRLSVTATVAASGTGGGPLLYSSGGAITFLVWGTQIEQGTFVTSYIPTSGATAVRSSDRIYIPDGTWFTSGQTTLQAVGSRRDNNTSNFAWMAVKDEGIRGLNNANIIIRGNTNNVIGGPILAGATINAAIATSSSGYSGSVNGGTVVTGSTSPQTTSFLKVGYQDIGASGTFTGNLTKIKYYPTRLSNTQLQLLTQ